MKAPEPDAWLLMAVSLALTAICVWVVMSNQ